jgi:hypothetical protein
VSLFLREFCKNKSVDYVTLFILQLLSILFVSFQSNVTIVNVTKQDIKSIFDKVFIHEKVCQSGLYNYEGCREKKQTVVK